MSNEEPQAQQYEQVGEQVIAVNQIQVDIPPANQPHAEELESPPANANTGGDDAHEEFDNNDEQRSVDVSIREDNDAESTTSDESQEQRDVQLANLDEVYQSVRAWFKCITNTSIQQVTTTNPDEGDLHPLRDKDGHVLEQVESDEEAVLEAPPEVANLRRRDEDMPSTSRCNDDLLPTANDPNQLQSRRQHYDEDLEHQPASTSHLSAETHGVSLLDDADYTALARRFYRMTPRCGDDDVDDSEVFPLGASAATHVERLMMARNDSNDVDDTDGEQHAHEPTTPPNYQRDSYDHETDGRPANNERSARRGVGRQSARQLMTSTDSRSSIGVTTRYQRYQHSPPHQQRRQRQVQPISPFATRSSNTSGMNAAAVVRARTAPASVSGALALGWQGTKSTLKERFSFMFCNEILADVHFLVGRGEQRQRVPAHKFVLSVGSAVFDAMFNGALGGNSDCGDIELPDVEPQAFLSLLNFLYSDDVNINPDTVMTTLYTAKKYAVPALENACVEFLKKHLSPDNAFMLLTQARLFDEPQLAALCLEMIDKHTNESLSADGFTDIDLETLCAVLERDTLRIREVVLFSAVARWSMAECHRQQLPVTPANQRQVLGRALALIRFPLMSVEEFAQTVAQMGILNDRELVNLFLYFTVNPKPSVAFLDVPRCCVTGKEQVVNRFQRIEGRWGYSGTPDRIKFTVDRHIYVVGFGLYGSIHGPTEYQCSIQMLHCGTGKTVAANETTFQCDGSMSTFRVLFKEPVELAPMVTYIASACLKGPDSHYGTKGLRRIVHQSPSTGCVTFQFTYAAGNNNGTSVEDGQIPEIIFYTKLS